jgi:hypothetical protein
MPAMEYQGAPSHSPFSSLARSLRSLRRDAPPPAGEDLAGLDAFQRHLAALLADLRDGDAAFLSAAWIRRLLRAFLACQEEFGAAAEFGERAVRALDVCNAARDGVDQVRRWGRLAGVAAAVLLGEDAPLHEGQLRRARKALSDLSLLLVDDSAAAAADATSVLASHRNRSFGDARASPSRAASSPSTHLRSLSWSVSRTWSAARQLQAIGSGLPPPQAGLPASAAHAMASLLHLAAWALVAALPCPDRAAALQQPAHHLPTAPPRAGTAFPWAPHLLALQERLAEEGKRRDRRASPGLLAEIRSLEKSAQRLAAAIDAPPLDGDRQAEIREAAADLAAVCAAVKDEVDPLERQIREVFHRIVWSRMAGLDSPPMINAD